MRGGSQPPQWTALEVVVEERARHTLDDGELRLLVRVRRLVRRADEPEQELGPVREPEVRGRHRGRIDRVAVP